MANGSVFVYNATNQSMQVTLNSVVCPTQDPATAVPGKSYTPSVVTYSRTSDPQPGNSVFGTKNSFSVKFSAADTNQYQININPLIWQLNYDLELYVTFSGIVLAYQGLVILQQFQPINAATIKLLEKLDTKAIHEAAHHHK